jgi:hypothetical protein
MSDLSANAPAPRPVSIFTVLVIFVGFALFALLVNYLYVRNANPATTGMMTGAFTDDGIHTAAQREKNLSDLRKKHDEQAKSYGWIDQKAGVVRLPIDRAIELTAQQYGPKK